jgi:hypothetical protein
MKPSEICDRAADVIDARGWAQKVYQTSDGRVCLIGALRIASEESLDDPTQLQPQAKWSNEYLFAAAAIRKTGGDISNLAAWNDTVPKHKDEVIKLLRNSAAFMREQNESAAFLRKD